MNLIIALIVAFAASKAFHKRFQYESEFNRFNRFSNHATALIEPLLLPAYILALFIIVIIINGFAPMGVFLISSFAILFLYISVYFTALLCVLPLLRRLISARACATLWLLPNLLYLTIYMDNTKISPLIAITLPRQWLMIFAIVWIMSFVWVLLWQIISHLVYRRFLLEGAVSINDANTISLWNHEQKRHGIKRSIPMLASSNTNTPVSIGCFSRTLRLVLPQTNYTQEELALIFQHELRHIKRLDIHTKAFLGFCTAMCWFNPLMWIARRRVSDDLELSCDEAVLADADNTTRQQYAELLLNATGNSKGYTTCLSKGATSMRYRLKNIVKPRKRFPGTVAIGVAMLMLVLGNGSLALVDSGGTVETIIFDNATAENVIDSIDTYNWSDNRRGHSSVYGWNEAYLTEYISSLHIKQVYAGDYSNEGLRQLYIHYAGKDEKTSGMIRIELCDGILWADIPYENHGNTAYILEDEVDWEYIESLLDFDAVNPDPAPHPPELMMYFNDDINPEGELMYASKTIIFIESGNERQQINENLNDSGIGGVSGYPVTQVQLYFSYEPIGEYEILVENWEHTKSYFVSSSKLTDGVLELAPYSAHYTVYGHFRTVRDTNYKMKFSFDIELPVE